MSVHGNLLFMSVEQTRGRLDCGVSGVEAPVSKERFRGVRIFDISDVRTPRQVAAVQTCRGSHTHTLVTDPKDPANVYVYGSGTSNARSAEELAGCSDKDPKDDPQTALFSIDVIKVPVARPQDAKIVARPRIFADEKGQHRRPVGRWRSRSRHAEDRGDQPVPRHHGVPGGRPRGWRVLGQWHPARHRRPGQPEAPRLRGRQELRVLALGDLQQRRHQGGVHRRVGRRHASALPGHRPGQLGRQRDLRHRRSQARVQELLQAAGAADGHGELRRAQRVTRPGARARPDGAGVVPGRRVGDGLHRLGQPEGDRLLRSRPARREAPHHGWVLVDVLVQRPRVRLGDVARPRRLPARCRATCSRRTRSTRRGPCRPSPSTCSTRTS